MDSISRRRLAPLALAVLTAAPAFATDGYFVPGFGVKQQGQGGGSVALPQDALAAAANPAGLAFVGDRLDLGLTVFRPIRGGTIVGNQLPPGYPNVNGDYDANGKKLFPIPEIGWAHRLGERAAVGVAVFGNGGLNTSYVTPIPLLGTSNAGVDLQQLFVSPTLAFKLGGHQAVGVSLNLAYQRFEAEGLENFASPGLSSDPSAVTNRDYASSFGSGVRVGWLGEITDAVSLGASFQSRTYAGKFKEYAGLFAEQGGFDVPATLAGGIAVKLHPKATVSLDVERIFYGSVASIANSGANQAPLGSDGGPGFGWQDVTVVKAGIAVRPSETLTLRAGYNHSGVPFAAGETFFNLLAPGVVQHHATLGATFGLGNGRDISVAYVHAFEKTVNGVNSIPPAAGGGNADVHMHQDSVAVGFGWGRH